MRKPFRAILAIFFSFFSLNAYGYEFDSGSKKALVVFMGKPQPIDFRLSASRADVSTKLLKGSKGFNLIVGEGTALFGPFTQTYGGKTQKLFVEHKKLKPGSYMFTTGFSWEGGHNVGCFGSKLFTVEAGKSYIVPLSDGRSMKAKGSPIDWNLSPNLSDVELRKVYNTYVAAEGHENATEIEVARPNSVKVDLELKGSVCHYDKSQPYSSLP